MEMVMQMLSSLSIWGALVLTFLGSAVGYAMPITVKQRTGKVSKPMIALSIAGSVVGLAGAILFVQKSFALIN